MVAKLSFSTLVRAQKQQILENTALCERSLPTVDIYIVYEKCIVQHNHKERGCV